MQSDRRAGVGVVLEARGRGPAAVAQVTPGGAAEASRRIRIGDILTRINGKSVAGLTPQEISNIIAGQEHTEVRLAFNRISDTGLTEEAYEVFLIRGLPRDSLQSEPPQPTTYTDYGSVPHWQQTPPTIVSPSIALDSGEDNSRGRVRSPLWEAMEDADSAEDGIPSRKSSGVDGFHFPPEVSLGSGGRFGDNGKAGAAQHPPSGGDSGEGLREGMRSLLEFLNSGYTSTSQYEDSPFMTGGSEDAELVKLVFAEVAALKSREAGSENVLRVAKETLDARKRQIKTLTVTIKRLQYQMGEGRGQIGEGRERPSDLFPAIHRPGEGSLAGLGLSGTVDEGLLANHGGMGGDPGDGEMRRGLEQEEETERLAAMDLQTAQSKVLAA